MEITRKYILLIILLILGVYSNSFQNEFVWDDEFLIVKNPAIMSWQYAWTHFALDLYHSYSNYYRPLQMMTYMIDFSIWRLNPFGYHLTNVVLHILVCISLFIFLKLMAEDGRIAFLGTLFYALHPAHTAAVAYIAGRADPLATFFTFLSLICFHLHFKSQKRIASVFLYTCSLLSFLLGLLSKEIVIILPAVMLCYRLFFITDDETEKSKKYLKFHYLSWFIIILGVYLLLRIYALNFLEGGVIKVSHSLDERLLTSAKAFVIYLGIIFLPVLLHMERRIPYATSFMEPDIILSLIVIFLLIWLTIRIRKISKIAFFGLLFFFITLLPVANLYPLPNNMAEHWLYMPLAGMSIFISVAGIRLWDNKRNFRPLLTLFITCYLMFFSYRTFARNFDWHDEHTIYMHTFAYSPKSIKMLNNLGNLYNREGELEMAIIFHNKAIAVNPKEYKTRLNLGHDYEALGMFDKALEQYAISVQLYPAYAKGYFRMGEVYSIQGKWDMAAHAYRQAIQCDDLHVGSHIQLGNVYFETGDYENAKKEYEEAIQINPYLAETYNSLGNALCKLGFYKKAIEAYKEAIDLIPEEAEYHKNLGTAYGRLGIYNEAMAELKEAYSLKPRDVETLINIGAVYYYNGDVDSATKEWKKALLVDPQNDIAIRYLEGISP